MAGWFVRRRIAGLILLLALASTGAAFGSAPVAPTRVSRLSAVEVAYLTSCGGCHGVEGASAPRAVPTLHGLTGTFLCTRMGRQFIVRIPDVALSSLSNRMLTEVMNWVVFDLGAPVAGKRKVRPYTIAEVTRLRQHPLTNTGLTAYRNRVVRNLAAHCRLPAGLRTYAEGVK